MIPSLSMISTSRSILKDNRAWCCGLASLVLVSGLHAGQGDVFTDGKAAASELGQSDRFTAADANRGDSPSAITLAAPSSVAVDPRSGKVFVADTDNHRVLRYASTGALADGAAAEVVLGQSLFGNTAASVTRSRFINPKAVCCDTEGRLWVLDGNRVLRFDGAANLENGANASGVLGQPDFFESATNNGQNGLGDPADLFVSETGSLWVSSPDLNRVTRFGSAATKLPGANADSVLGQVDFVASAAATTISGMSAPAGITVDLAGNLYVADSGNHRVLIFPDAETGANGRAADVYLGQLRDIDATAAAGTEGMNTPVDVSINPAGTLFVADQGNDRILLFFRAASKGNTGAADGVLGQTNLESQSVVGIERRLQNVQGIWADGNRRVWAADPSLHRVLRFETDRYQPDALIGPKLNSMLGEGRYNQNGVGQTTKLVAKGVKTSRGFLRFQNDGDVVDGQNLTASSGNRFIKLEYFRNPGANVTAAITSGRLYLTDVTAGASSSFQIRATGERKFPLRNATLKAKIVAKSTTDGSIDRVNCTVVKQR